MSQATVSRVLNDKPGVSAATRTAVLEAVDAKALGFLRVANAALAVMTASGYGRVIGVSGQNAFLTGNVTGAVRNAALIIAATSRLTSFWIPM